LDPISEPGLRLAEVPTQGYACGSPHVEPPGRLGRRGPEGGWGSDQGNSTTPGNFGAKFGTPNFHAVAWLLLPLSGAPNNSRAFPEVHWLPQFYRELTRSGRMRLTATGPQQLSATPQMATDCMSSLKMIS
jgi:hypothetical protein